MTVIVILARIRTQKTYYVIAILKKKKKTLWLGCSCELLKPQDISSFVLHSTALRMLM